MSTAPSSLPHHTYKAASALNLSFCRQIYSLDYSRSATTTVSRFFSDKSPGAVPQDPESEEASNPPVPAPLKRPTILQRLHIHSSGKKPKPKPPTLEIRPTTSSSLPVPSTTDSSRAPSSHSDAATIAEITQMMPQSLSLNTPPSNTGKRQRSRDSRHEPSRPPSAGQGGPASLTEEERLARTGVKMPAYLNKSRLGMLLSPLKVLNETLRILTINRDPSCISRPRMETAISNGRGRIQL